MNGLILAIAALLGAVVPLYAGEADLIIPNLRGNAESSMLLFGGMGVCILGLVFGFMGYVRLKNIKAHKSMLDIGSLIFETCKTYLIQQGKFLVILEILIGTCIAIYFGWLQKMAVSHVALILAMSLIGILGSYGVAWFGIRINTLANARMAFASLRGKPYSLLQIPLHAGMSIGVALVSVELIIMLAILLFIPSNLAGACFIGFAIGESLGASVLRICGGIFTKIADVGSDLMKIVFKIGEDDPRNPGVIADCTGDNAGDSVGPTADGFETYGVTGVALISFIVLAVHNTQLQLTLLTWIFVMRVLMVVTSIGSYYINDIIGSIRYANKKELDFEAPLTSLVWLTSAISIVMTFAVSYWQLGPVPGFGRRWAVMRISLRS